ncbi:adrenergic, beta-1-, receptor [Plakobranchus ocellatus]|uniref:Adrenergic, beta-1-, receptor n=1 Tax=Plakobranchus ocellatus TaxID=259542 RepID=A0AAV4DRC9_9GAST|nr:adrenergic, beta-1-, receptor [Plakobranchus ocellatus]
MSSSPFTQRPNYNYPSITMKSSYGISNEETLPSRALGTSYGTHNGETVQTLQELTTESHTERYGCSDEHFSSDPLKYLTIPAGFAIMIENLILIIIICRCRSLHTITNIFVVSMAVTDLSVGYQCVQLGFLLQSGGMRSWLRLKGDQMHLFLSLTVSANTSLVLVSLIHMCLLAVDRYLFLLFPFRYERFITRRRVLTTVCIVWTLGLIYVAAVTSLLQKEEYRKTCVLSQVPLIFTYWPLVAVYILCLVVVLTCTLGIARIALKHGRKRKERKAKHNFCHVNYKKRTSRTDTGQGISENTDMCCYNRRDTVHSLDVSFHLTRSNANMNGVNNHITISGGNGSCDENNDKEISKTVAIEISSLNVMTTTSLHDDENTTSLPKQAPHYISTTNDIAKSESSAVNNSDTFVRSARGNNNSYINDYRQESRLFSKANLKLIKFVLVLFGALFVCSAPSIVIITMVNLFKIVQLPYVLIRLMQVLLISNSCMNFFIISYMNKDFRQALIRHLPCCAICCSRKTKRSQNA